MNRHARILLSTGLLLLVAQLGFAQGAPLTLFENYPVRGDYVVAGVGLEGRGVNGLATGTIDLNTTDIAVPQGADIVAAFLYWETVVKTSPPPTSMAGYFGYSANTTVYKYAMTGTSLGNGTAPCWSSGGGTGNSGGTTSVGVYRANVLPYFPLDTNPSSPTLGKIIIGNGQFSVSLPDTGSTGNGPPLTLGASLVVVYRVLTAPGHQSDYPLKYVVIYDGAWTMNNATPYMNTDLKGFYQSGTTGRLTHVVGNGSKKKTERLSFQNQTWDNPFTGLSASPYLDWDNPTFSVSVTGGLDTVTTKVLPINSTFDCLNWGVVIFSTPVPNDDGDGLLNAWKQHSPPGYTDVKSNQWIALPGAQKGQKDIFIELDWLTDLDDVDVSKRHSHLLKRDALDWVGDAFKKAGYNLHFDVGNNYQGLMPNGMPDPYIIPYDSNSGGGNSIPENAVVCSDSASELCAFPGQPAVGWKAGFLVLKNATTIKDALGNDQPGGKFQPGRKDSYHYVLSGHSLGVPRSMWTAAGNTVNDSSIPKLVSIVVPQNSGEAVTTIITTQSPLGYIKPGDISYCTAVYPDACDRVTITGAIGQPALNGTYHFTGTGDTISIQTTGVAGGTYDFGKEPQLELDYGGPTSTSGHSDLAGADSALTFGLWPADNPAICNADPSVGPPYCDDQVGSVQSQAGTLMHELGHALSLTHGGTYYDDSTHPTQPTSYEPNCKPNYLSVMNYLFQIDLLGQAGNVLDYSGYSLSDLSETVGWGIGNYWTKWYIPTADANKSAKSHCDGTAKAVAEQMLRVEGSGPIPAGDTNFDGRADELFRGYIGSSTYDDWDNVDLQQIGATGSDYDSGGIIGSRGGGIIGSRGGGIIGSRGGGIIGSRGGGILGSRGGGLGELTHDTANSVVRRPTSLTATITAPHYVTLNWSAPNFGQIRTYHVYRAVYGQPATQTKIGDVVGAPPLTTYTDESVVNNTTYTYFVTAALEDGSESEGSDPVVVHVAWGYTFIGFMSPLTTAGVNSYSGTWNLGKAVPIKWQLKDITTGQLSSDTTALQVLTAYFNGQPPSNGTCPVSTSGQSVLLYTPVNGATGNSTFRYDTTNSQFIFNWDTTANYGSGCYTLVLQSRDTIVPNEPANSPATTSLQLR